MEKKGFRKGDEGRQQLALWMLIGSSC